MKKLVVGLSLYKPNERQELCIQSLLKLQGMFNFDLLNLQFRDREDEYTDPRIPTMYCLEHRSRDFVGTKNMPIIKEMFEVLSELQYDYFCFTNNDIIISDRYFNFINNTDYDCYPACRLAIQPIKTFDDPIVGSHYQCVGFDTYTVRTEWWRNNRYRFLDYIVGHANWDVDYATVMKIHGNTFLVNDWPPSIFHIIHEAPWTTTEKASVEKIYNDKLFATNQPYYNIWWNYVYKVPLTRGGNYWYPHPNEKEIEKAFFKL